MATSLPGDPVGLDGASALLRDLCARLSAGPSATAVLEEWCRARGFAAAPDIVAHAVAAPERPATGAQRDHLRVSGDETVRYRRVRLTCGSRLLSQAENWYVPARLTPAMNRALESSEVPFGRVVQALTPSRRTLALHLLPAAGAPGAADVHEPLFTLQALLLSRDGLPLCEVGETYTAAVLSEGRGR